MKFINILVVVALMTGGLHLHAQDFGVEYTTELQTNFQGCNFVNLLRLNAVVPISKSMAVEASTISIAKTRNERLLDDLQTFSNIEEDNLPLAIAVCGANWQINDKHSLFMGIRNMNEDYFTSPVTSFFTNSSCGIYPTISANYPIANYPVASVGMHYCYDGSPIKVQASLYNGTGYNRFTGRENVFRVCPKNDGVFGIAEVEYQHKGSSYFMGACVHYKSAVSESEYRKVGSTLWSYAEQKMTNRVSLIAAYSHAFSRAECPDFIGIGGKYTTQNCELGIFSDMARFEEATEFATEITGKYQFTPNIYAQPSVHAIFTGHSFRSVVSLRFGVNL